MNLTAHLLLGVAALSLVPSCGRQRQEASPSAATSARPSPSSSESPVAVEPTRLATLSISAYSTSLSLDDEAAYLLTGRAAYRLVPGQPAQGIELELGQGAVLTPSAFIFWSRGAIWRAPKVGGVTRAIAKVAHQPQYFVAAGEDFVWIDASDQGVHTIQRLEGQRPRVLVSSSGELSALHVIEKDIYFVERPTDGTWRLGVVAAGGGEPRYGPERKGRRPALLTGTDHVYYYDLDGSEIRRRSLDLLREETRSPKLVCSPIHVASAIYCGSVEGLFEVSTQSQRPRVLSYGRPGSITNLVADSKRVVWTVDLGADMLAVDTLAASAAP